MFLAASKKKKIKLGEWDTNLNLYKILAPKLFSFGMKKNDQMNMC